jgi:coproporphyrinogen III oxidase-like Fe-S oxidoreductase
VEVSAREQAEEYLMMGLRLSEGVRLDRLRQLDQNVIDEERIVSLEELGLLQRDEEVIKATDHGASGLNAVLRELLA